MVKCKLDVSYNLSLPRSLFNLHPVGANLSTQVITPVAPNFVHLHLHSEYSMVDSLVRIDSLAKAVAAAGMPAVAITDQSNLFAAVKFYKDAEKFGIKPIVGVDAWVHNSEDPNRPFRLLLLVQNLTGYRNLTKLVSRSYQEGQHSNVPTLQKNWFATAHEGLIFLSGGYKGDVGQALLAGHSERAETLLTNWIALVGDRYYLEVTRTGREYEEEYLQLAVDLAIHTDTPVVATNDVCFLHAQDFEAHEVRVCVNQGCTLNDPQRLRNYSTEQYLRSPEEMAILFADLPEALENSVEIAQRCNLAMSLGKNYLPQFPTPAGLSLNDSLRNQSHTGLEQRLITNKILLAERRQVYLARLEQELSVIVQMGFAGYFLIVADFIQWAKDHDIPVGPGRGSGAGSLVAYALKITDLDPLPYDLLFERFLNPERVSMPDFDIDFCMEGRDRVIDYVADRYGRDAVSQIITYGSMAAKAAVRDVGRVLGIPYGFVDRIAKLIPLEIGITLNKAIENVPELKSLYKSEEEVTSLLDMASTLEGLTRNAGRHAGGVVIAPGKLTDFVPLYCESDGKNLVTQFDKDDVEQVGLVKFDFLGLRTLTIIDWALKNINRIRKIEQLPPIEINALPLDDQASFELLKRGDTTAVFQLESRGMKELIKKLKPDTFEDIVALVALYRPGPLGSGMVDDFINRKHGLAKVEYTHPALEPILKPTYGTILYQEQVMQIAQVLGGFSLGSADLLRRAMGKKSQDVMDKQRAIFVQGAIERGVQETKAKHIFDLMAEFANYGFNKSHSAAYALISFQTAWLKAHYPAAFMAAVLSADLDNTEKVVNFIDECRQMQLTVQPPDVNCSEYRFTIADVSTIVYGLGAIKGIGEAAIEGILEARAGGGIFTDLFDFCRRVDLHRVNRRVLEAMIRAGAMDKFGLNRATLMLQLPLAVKLAEQQRLNQHAGFVDLFGGDTATVVSIPESAPIAASEWGEEERLQGEKATLGLYLTGHPIDRFINELKQLSTGSIAELLADSVDMSKDHGISTALEHKHSGRRVIIVGWVYESHHRNSSKGRMGTITLDDRTGRIEVTVFNDQYKNCRTLLNVDQILVVHGTTMYDDYRNRWSVRADQVLDLEQARAQGAKRLVMRIDGSVVKDPKGFTTQLRNIITPCKGGHCKIVVEYQRGAMRGVLEFGHNWLIHPKESLLKELRELLGLNNLWLQYGHAGREFQGVQTAQKN